MSVERSPTRCIADAEYEKVGCTLVASETWKEAPTDAMILGLKELPDVRINLQH
jgi:saccharopine dehydrogenase (NAD+, L-lysine-forming)